MENPVQFEYGRDAEDGSESETPLSVTFINQAQTGVDSFRLSYESPSAVPIYRDFLRSVYGVAGDYPFQVRRPDWITVERDGIRNQYDRTYSLVASANDGRIEIAIVDYIDEPSSVVPHEWRPGGFIATVTVPVDEYVEQIVTAAERYISRATESERLNPDERVVRLLDDAKAVRNAVREERSLDQFRLAPDSPGVQSYLYDNSFTDTSISYFLVERGVVREEMHRLRERENSVSEKYQKLLSHDSRLIQKAVAEILEERPDERAKEWLLGRRWTERPEIVRPALRAGAHFDDEDVRDALCETVDFSSHADIRATAVELLGDYPDGETVDVLESLVEDDADETVRTAARETLSRIRD